MQYFYRAGRAGLFAGILLHVAAAQAFAPPPADPIVHEGTGDRSTVAAPAERDAELEKWRAAMIRPCHRSPDMQQTSPAGRPVRPRMIC